MFSIAYPAKVTLIFKISGGQGDWSTEGCTLVQKQGKELVCHCNHMTNFALIFGAKEPTEEGHRLTLSALTYFGCGFSLMGAFITLIAYIFLL